MRQARMRAAMMRAAASRCTPTDGVTRALLALLKTRGCAENVMPGRARALSAPAAIADTPPRSSSIVAARCANSARILRISGIGNTWPALARACTKPSSSCTNSESSATLEMPKRSMTMSSRRCRPHA